MLNLRLLTFALALGFMYQYALGYIEAGSLLIDNQIVEASCGQCQFHMKGKGCDLAVRINGKSYFVDGTSIDDHGDAHASDGFCASIRKARVSGKIVNGRFQASSFTLLPSVQKNTP